jgi:hypothetical protein
MVMMMAGGHGHENPNANYMNGRGFWLFYVLVRETPLGPLKSG